MTLGHSDHLSIFHLFVILSVLIVIPAQGGEVTVHNGIPIVHNSTRPDRGRTTIELEELWSAGGEDDDMVFGLITQVRTDDEGYIYLLDTQLCQVYVYSPEGEYLRSLFREGDGPGEIREPVDMLILEDGSVGAAHEFPAVITIVDKQGNPAGSLQLGGDDPVIRSSISLIGCDSNGGNIVLSGTRFRRSDTPGIQDRTNFLSSFSRTGEELVCYVEAETQFNFNDLSFIEREHSPHFWWGYCVGSDGDVYVAASRDDYRVNVYARDGTLTRIIEREIDVWHRTDDETERMRRMIESATSWSPNEVRIVVEDTEPAIAYFHRGMRLAKNGNLWVLPSRGLREQPKGIFLTYDVFDRDGHFIQQVSVRCDGNPMSDGLFIVDDNRAIMVKGYLDALAAQFGRGVTFGEEGDEAALMEVTCYAIRGDLP